MKSAASPTSDTTVKLFRRNSIRSERTYMRRRFDRRVRLQIESLEDRLLLANWSGDVFDTAPGVPLWTNAEVQRVVGNVHVPAGKTLTVQAGTVVQFDGGTNLTVDGTLIAMGSSNQTVFFTSVRDNSPTGGSDTAGAGDWGAITINSGSDASMLDHVVVRYGGSFSAAELIVAADVTIANSTFSNTPFLSAGVHISASNPTLTNLTFQNNYAAASMDVASSPTIQGVSASGNSINGMRIDGGSLTSDVTWNSPDMVYLVNGRVTVPQGRKLTIGDGQVVKLTNLFVFDYARIIVDGTLSAQGTASQPVVLTSFRDDTAGGDTNNDGQPPFFGPGKGDWAGIQFNATSTANLLDHVEVRYGGSAIGAAILDDHAPLTLTNSIVRDSTFFGAGVRIVSANPVITGVTFQNNDNAAVSADLAAHPTIRNVTMSNNRYNGMLIDAGSLPANTTWDNPDIVYVPQAGTTTVPTGITLTIAPGVIVKPAFNIFLTNMLRVEGTLKAQGTAEKPIIFTALPDASAGGSTNQESVLGAGEGYGFLFTTTSTGNVMDHVDVRYGTSLEFVVSGLLGTVNADGPLTLSNSIVRNSGHVGVFVSPTGTATLTSNLIVNNISGVQAQAGSMLTAINNTIDGSAVFGVILDSPNATLTNNLVTNSGNAGIRQTGPTNLTMNFNDVFNPGRTNYSGLTDKTGTGGNISLDPQYFNRTNRQYQLRPGSPVADAGTSSGAPLTDFFGNPRFDDPNIAGRGDGSGFDMGAIEVQEVATSTIDLATFNVSGPTSGTQGMNATINWTVKNIGSDAATGSWSDAIYLSDKPFWTPTARFLKREQHTGDLGPGTSYTASTSVTLSNVIPGNHYFIVRTNDLSDVFEGLATANNPAAPPTPISFALPTLTLNTPFNGQFTAVGEADYYQITVSGGQTLEFSLQSAAGTGSTELYVSRGAVPSRSEFDFSGGTGLTPNQKVTVPTTQPGTYYVLAYASSGSAATSAYTLTASQAAFGVQGVSPSTAGNGGQVTLTINGSLLTADTEASLIAPDSSVIPALATQLTDATQLQATFDLTGKATGLYGVRVKRGSETATAANALTVNVGTTGHLRVEFTVPGLIRAGRQGTVTVDYTNDGGADLPAPILTVTSNSPTLRFAGDANARGDTVEFLAINSSGPAGVLPPGARSSIEINFIAGTDASSGDILFRLLRQSTLADNTPFDWSAAKNQLRPPSLPTDAWDAVYANFMADVGTTLGQFQALLDRAATYLSSLGEYTGDEGRLLALEFQQAGNFGALTQRYTLGAFGRGVPDPTAFTATTDAAGNVTLLANSRARTFLKQANNSYRGGNGDLGVLTLENGAYRLKETDGSLIVFRTDGRLDFRQDRNGNRVTAGYTGSQLTSYTDNFGNTTALRYNALGRIDRVTDPVGRVADFTYGAAGEHLLSIANAQGTQQFTYVTGQGPQKEHALASITHLDGSHTFFEYDSRGRVSRTTADGGANAVTYTYDAFGGLTVTDAQGNRTTTLFNEFGQPAMVQDALGQVTRMLYDRNRNLTEIRQPDGGIVVSTPDGPGNPTIVVDPLGHSINATFDAVFNTLQMIRDPGGTTLSFRMDARGNPLNFTYPDGSSEKFTYDTAGNVLTKIDPQGNEVRYTYDANNLLIRQEFVDGSRTDFTYDAHRNLATATNAAGTTTYNYDLATDRLSKVTYPGGRFLSFNYDAAGRRAQSVDQDGFTVNYSYDALGRLSGLTNGAGQSIASHTYDSVGRLQRQDMGNGTLTTYAYDAASQLTSLVNRAADNSVLSSFDYSYDTMGRRLTMTTTDGTTTYGYDAKGQLTSVTLPGGRTITYQYDAAGNRVAVNDGGTMTNYSTNNMNQYTAAGAAQFTYDANGNLLSRTDGNGTTAYEYNLLGQLASVTTPTDTFSYIYDAVGVRIAVIRNGVRTDYVVDPAGLGSIVAEYGASGQLVAHYTQGAGLTSRVDAGGTASYYAFDGIGNTSLITAANGTVANRYSYLPFGESLSASGTLPNPFSFGGRFGIMSEGDGLYFMRARYYEASAGRFVQMDPIKVAGGLNLYRFADNNPISNVDPTGLAATPAEIIGLQSVLRKLIEQHGLAAVGRLTNQLLTDTGYNIRQVYLTLRSVLAAGEIPELVVLATEEAAVSGAAETLAGETIVSGGAAETIVAEGAAGGGGAAGGSSVGAAVLPALGAGLVAGAATYVIVELWDEMGLNDAIAEKYSAPHRGDEGQPNYGAAILAEATKLGLSAEGYLQLVKDGVVQRVRPEDPNDIAGPLGFGSQHFVTANETFPYTIHFENLPAATAPALVVAVTQQLDANLDWSTFELGDFGFGKYIVEVPAGRRFYSTRVDASDTRGEFVDVTADFDPTTGKSTWTFTSVDPATGALPEGATDGFLPPEDGAGSGQGFVTYRVRPKTGGTTSTVVPAQARVIFEAGLPDESFLDTPSFTNTIDAGGPTSTVTALPANSPASFTVNWSGGEDTGGSGIATFDVFVSDNGGPFTLFQDDTTTTSAMFAGEVDHTYGFFSVATDNVGHIEPMPAGPDTTTFVSPDSMPPILSNVPASRTVEATSAAGAVVTYTLPTATDAVDPDPTVSCLPASGSTFPLGTTQVTCTATDDAGNTSQPAMFNVTVRDVTAPMLVNMPPNQTVPATSAAGATAKYTLPGATDTVDSSPAVSCSPSSGSVFPFGITTVTCTATDLAGNINTGSFTVTVQDTVSPTVNTFELIKDARGKKVTQLIVAFDEAIAADAAETVDNYRLVLQKGRKTKAVPIVRAAYNAAAAEVTLTPVKALAVKSLGTHRLSVRGDGTLADLAGNGFDGNGDGTAGGDYIRSLSQATTRAAPRLAAFAAVDEVLASDQFPYEFRDGDEWLSLRTRIASETQLRGLLLARRA